MEHIRRLKLEGKIRNIGLPMQPIYVPVEGYYGISFSVIGSKRVNTAVPFIALPVRLAMPAAICVLSPTRTKRGIFGVSTVSYTHLDVYKRQKFIRATACNGSNFCRLYVFSARTTEFQLLISFSYSFVFSIPYEKRKKMFELIKSK